MKRSEIVKGGRYAYNESKSQYWGFKPYDAKDYGTHEAEVLDTAPADLPWARRTRRTPSGVLVKIKQHNGRFGDPVVVPLAHLRMTWAEYREIRASVDVVEQRRKVQNRLRRALGSKVVKALEQRFPDEGFYISDHDAEKGRVMIDLNVLAGLLDLEPVD